MGKSSPAAPTPPDPYATASAQSTANAGTATAQAALNNANVNNPYGSTSFQVTGQQDITNPDGTHTSVPTYTENQTLSGAQQNLLNQNNQLSSTTNKVAQSALNNIGSTLSQPITSDSLASLALNAGAAPTLANSYASGQLATGYDQGGGIQSGYNVGGPIQTSVPVQQADTSFGATQNGVQYFNPQDTTQAVNDATNAALARLSPSMNSQNAALQSQLANQGVTAGSQAYNDAMLQNSQGNNDLRLGAVATGDAEQQALFGQQATANQLYNAAQSQDYSEQQGRGQFQQAGAAANNAANLAAGTFANTAQGQQNEENAAQGAFYNAAQGQQNQENAAAAAFGNTATSTQAQMNAAQAAFGNSAATQDYQNRLAGSTFQNSAAAQQLQQQMALQNQQINEISALRSGGQVAQLQGPSYQSAQIDQTPLSSDVYSSASLAQQTYAQQVAAQNANNSAFGNVLGGLTGGIGKSVGSKSDRRLKSEIERVGTASNGLPIYVYRLQGAPGWHMGFMADEVALRHPNAVWTDPDDGFARVDYEMAVL